MSSTNSIVSIGPKPKIGLEIEANWPSYSALPSATSGAFDNVAKLSSQETQNRQGGEDAYHIFRSLSGNRSRLAATPSIYPEHRPLARTTVENMPEHLQFPLGWEKGHDAGIEMRFDGPASSLSEALDRVKRGTKWLRDFGFTTFSGAGTHVHLGHLAWLDEIFGSLSEKNPLRGRAEQLMWAYFVTREAAIFALAPQHRLNSTGYCRPYFAGGSNDGFLDDRNSTYVSKDTPLWAVHNFFAARPVVSNSEYCHNYHAGLAGSSTQNRRKGLPTIEFRHFAGTHAETAVSGYVRLLCAMFARATTVVTAENLKAKTETAASDSIIVNPYNYTVHDLKKELDDPWLLTWIDKTLANNGNPITDEITINSEASAPLAVSAV